MKRLKSEKKIELSYATVELFKPTIIRIEITLDMVVTKAEAKELNDIMGQLTQEQAVPYMLLAHENTQFDSSSRDYAASEEGSRYKKAEALIIRTLTHRLLADLYLKINKPIKPCQTFTNEEDAVDWLLSFL
ncbi:MAG: hypothetical protein HYX39_01055 [Bacteroidetes bacterium]|nr:hypothetical protein [Bacteroidota bacterium]